MEDWYRIPELVALDSQRHLVRIPPEVDVPLTDRVCHLIDTPEFRRLARISQLGLVSLVYPAAHHTRFEHSLGVYRLALLFLKHLSHDRRFRALVDCHDAERLLVTALLHDVGHWPFCHPIEDMRLEGVPGHEVFLRSFLAEGGLGELLREEWNIDAEDVLELLNTPGNEPRLCLLRSILSGPIDIDKMDYLYRDSLHAGVPYGRFFDQQRLVSSLCVNEAGNGLAITEKGKTAAELMVFARYVMFSEVYWHHAVRSATAMFQRAFYELYQTLDLAEVLRLTEWEFVAALREAAKGRPVTELLDGLFGKRRALYKRIVQYQFFHDPDLYGKLAGRPYHWLVQCCRVLCDEISKILGRKIDHHKLLLDAPPTHKEIEFQVEVFFPKEDVYRPLRDVSPVVRALAQEQFDHYVKRVRLFGAADIAGAVRSIANLRDLILNAIEITETNFASHSADR